MNYSENAINIITAETYKGVGKAWIVKNLNGNESVDTIISLLEKDNKYNDEDFERKKRNIQEKINALEDCCDGIVALGDKNFPQHRGNVKESDRPTFLFYKGNLDLLDINNLNITVIGLLNPDLRIAVSEKMVTEKIIKQLNATIVSGLALGCDSIAHETALEQKGKTIAILPSPLSNILPASNKKLAYKIVEEGGLLITEYYEDVKNPKFDLGKRYTDRDRLQALYCDAIVLAASYAQDSANLHPELAGQKLDSGARLAMGKAKDYGIKRAVIYNETHENNPMYDLNRQILKEDRTVISINSDNMSETINKLLPTKPLNISPKQLSLF